ncbi:MAG: ABC transporter permease [Desulfuromonas sp.]|nr:ABC transporter permease [Desulfuromonas sp.]
MFLWWRHFYAFMLKELQLLRRDRGALLILFLMPVALVIIVSLVQDNILKVTGSRTVKLLLVDNDHGYLGQQLLHQLHTSDSLQVTCAPVSMDYAAAKLEVSAGNWQVGIYLPAGISQQLHQQAVTQVRNGFTGRGGDALSLDQLPPLEVEYFFDPAVQGGLQAGISGMLRQLITSTTLTEQVHAFQQMLPAYIERQVSSKLGPLYAQVLASSDLSFKSPVLDQPILQAVQINPVAMGGMDDFVQPTSVQHNVPAWSLFGIFFIILPVAGVILQERSHGIFPRILIVPGSKLVMLLGRLSAYLLVCMLQFCLMLLVGYYLLPRLGTDILQFNGQMSGLLVVALGAGITACGFGLLLGVVARSEQQAIMLAAVSIVIAAALGGIMVPVYMMPPTMQQLSFISPLGWGLDACQVLLLRGGTLLDILPQLLTMMVCFVGCLLLAWRRIAKN